MKLPLLAALILACPAAYSAEEAPNCQLSATPKSCGKGDAYAGANKSKQAFERDCEEATAKLQTLKQNKQQIASRCDSIGQSKSGQVAKGAKGEGSGAHNEMDSLGAKNASLAKNCASQMAGVAREGSALGEKLGKRADAVEQQKSSTGGAVQKECKSARDGNEAAMNQARDGYQRLQKSAQSTAKDADSKKATYEKLGSALGGMSGSNVDTSQKYTTDKSKADAVKASSGKDVTAGKQNADPGADAGGGQGDGAPKSSTSGESEAGKGGEAEKKQEGGGGGGGGGAPKPPEAPPAAPAKDNSAATAAAAKKAEEEKKAKAALLKKEREEEAKKKADAERAKAIELNNSAGSGPSSAIQH